MKILVSSIKQRDVDHFEMVYNYYMPVLYRFAMQYAYDSETAKDLVHDAFAWVWNNPDKIRDEGTWQRFFTGWYAATVELSPVARHPGLQ